MDYCLTETAVDHIMEGHCGAIKLRQKSKFLPKYAERTELVTLLERALTDSKEYTQVRRSERPAHVRVSKALRGVIKLRYKYKDYIGVPQGRAEDLEQRPKVDAVEIVTFYNKKLNCRTVKRHIRLI